MAARKHRIFFMDTPFLLEKQAMFVSPVPAVTGDVLAIEWAHRDLITKEVYMESRVN